MTVAEIKQEVRQIIQQLDPNNSNVSDSTILGWINACTLQLCATITTLPKEEFTLTAANTLTFGQTLIKVDFASIADPVDGHHYPLITMDYVNFVRTHPYYQDEPTKRPSILVRKTDLTWDMWPKPDTTWTGASVTLVGTTIPANLTTDTQEPPISKTMHTAYPHYCAWKAFLLLNNPERAAQEFGIFDSLKKINMQASTSTTGNLLALRISQ
jgi:hypothetical protein